MWMPMVNQEVPEPEFPAEWDSDYEDAARLACFVLVQKILGSGFEYGFRPEIIDWYILIELIWL